MSRICFKRICGKGVSGSGKETQMKQGWPTGWELSKLGEGTWGSLYYYSTSEYILNFHNKKFFKVFYNQQ